MISFHGDIAVKNKYLARVEQHRLADEIVRGTGYQPANGKTKGKMCAVGCTLEAYDHSRYPIELGLPEWLARLEDELFEGMSLCKSETWPEDFLKAIPLGITENRFTREVKAPFLVIVLQGALTTFDNKKFPDCVSAINACIALWQRTDINSENWHSAAYSAADSAGSAYSAAYSAADSAYSAAYLAAYLAAYSAGSAAYSAAYSARSAADSAAYSAAYSARSAARSAAHSAKMDYFANELLKLLRAL